MMSDLPKLLRRLAAHPVSTGLILGLLLWALAWLVVWAADTLLARLTPSASMLAEVAFFLLLGISLRWLLRARHRTADELRKLSRAVEQSPSTVIITDLKGRIEYANPKFTQLTGYTMDEVRGQNPRLLKSGHTPPEVYAEMWRTISSGGEWRGEFHNVKKNGELYWESASLSPIRDAAGRITHYLAVKEDITARKAAEDAERAARRLAEGLRDQLQQYAGVLEQRVAERTQALEQQRSQLQAILDGMGEGVAYMEDGTIVFTNRALITMLGYTGDNVSSAALTEAVGRRADVGALRQEMRRSFAEGRIWRKELRVQRQDGSPLDVALAGAPVPGSKPGVTNTVLIVRDISQEKALQAQKDRFLTHAAHELRTPITNLKTRLYLARSQPDRADAHLQVMGHAVATMTELVEDLLDVLRLGQSAVLEREDVALDEIVRGALALHQPDAAEHGVTLSGSVPDEPVRVRGDAVRLAQAVDRLLINAIHHTARGGQVRVSLAMEDGGVGLQAVLRIADEGQTIAPTERSQVFEPFFNASQGNGMGMGLGLSIAREIVRLHDGEIALDAQPDGGNLYSVRLDAVR